MNNLLHPCSEPTANSRFTAGDRIYVLTPGANVAVAPLVGNSYYYVTFSNTSAIALATTPTGANLVFVPNATSTFTANLFAVLSTIKLATANSKFQGGDRFYYGVPTGNTPVAPLTGNSYYYVTFSNTTVLTISATQSGANITLSPSYTSTEVHTITGDTATGWVDVSSVFPQVTHSGWVLRREGTGGRAGRVTYETLVASGSIGTNTTSSTGSYGAPTNLTSNATVDKYV